MYDQRAYARGSHFGGEARVSRDGNSWSPADVSDVSSGGLKLHSSEDYAEGDTLWFNIRLAGFFSEFEIKTLGEVRRKTPQGGLFHYGIAFRGLSPEKKIQIDENVRRDRPVAGGGYEVDG